MGRRWGKCDFSELKKLSENLQKLEQVYSDEFCEQMAKELAQRLLRRVRQRTPVGEYETISYETKDGRTFSYNEGKSGGTLRRNWTVRPIEKHGNEYVVEVVNATEYASYVEYGHRQQPGRFVPQIGKSLKTAWVPGRFMLTISEQEVQNLAPKLLEKRLTEKLREIFNDT